jgi:hypothetical protein
VSKIKADIKKLNDKQHIIERIHEMEKAEKYEIDKMVLIGDKPIDDTGNEPAAIFATTSLEIFQPRHVNTKLGRKSNAKKTSFLSKLVSSMEAKPSELTVTVTDVSQSIESISSTSNISNNDALAEENKKSPPTNRKSAAQLDSNYHQAKTSTSSFTIQIDTIVEETND